MAEPNTADSSPDTDRDFDPSADMLVHDYDDEHTLAEEEQLSNSDGSNELDELQKEGDMPIEELLAMYGYGAGGPLPQSEGGILNADRNESRSSSEEEILSNQDLTLDKEEVARDLLAHDDEESNKETSANDLLQCVKLPSATARLLRSNQEDESDDSDDADYRPIEEGDWKKTIQVGSDYQAAIPDGLHTYGDAPAYENEDRLLWDPHKLGNKDVESFLREVEEQNKQASQQFSVHAIPQGAHISDDEQALFLLLQCGHNVDEALRRRKMQAVPATDPMSLWSEEECRNFENGLKTYGKDFYLIQQYKVKTRSVGELVQFYYLWKKTERHDMFANKNRLEKKKYALRPGVTDYMERFLDEQESAVAAAGPGLKDNRPASPIHSLLYGDTKRQDSQPKTPTQEEIAAMVEMVQKVVDNGELASKLTELAPELQTGSPTIQTLAALQASGDHHHHHTHLLGSAPPPPGGVPVGHAPLPPANAPHAQLNGDIRVPTMASATPVVDSVVPHNAGDTPAVLIPAVHEEEDAGSNPPQAKRAKLDPGVTLPPLVSPGGLVSDVTSLSTSHPDATSLSNHKLPPSSLAPTPASQLANSANNATLNHISPTNISMTNADSPLSVKSGMAEEPGGLVNELDKAPKIPTSRAPNSATSALSQQKTVASSDSSLTTPRSLNIEPSAGSNHRANAALATETLAH